MVAHKIKTIIEKFKLIWTIFRSHHIMVFTKRGDNPVTQIGFGTGELKDVMLMAIEMQRARNNLVNMANEQATEFGQLHALKELREVVEELTHGGH